MGKWISVHLFSSLHFDDIIRNAVGPFFQETELKSLTKRFFFIRYWEGGQHIRVRILPTREEDSEKICNMVKTQFGAFLSQYPSERLAITTDASYPNDSIQFIPYQREIRRYGGSHAMELAEEHFELSSVVALELICNSANVDYERRLAQVVNLNIAFAKCVFESEIEKNIFFRSLYWQWLPHAIKALGQIDTELATIEKLHESYSMLFHRNKENFIQCKNLIESYIDDSEKFDQTWMNSWVDGTNKIHKQLLELSSEDLIDIPGKAEFSSVEQIYFSYFHMLNNRLGIHNKDESLIAYILYNIFNKPK